MTLRRVAIFDVDLPAGVAFVRSLGRAGVPTTLYSRERRPAASFSRFAGSDGGDTVRSAPNIVDTDTFADWLTDSIAREEIDLVAPTSDFVAYAVAEAHERLGIIVPGEPTPAAVRDSLFKDWFATRAAEAGFPTPPSAAPKTVEGAVAAAERLGYPVVLKPRSHIAAGLARGAIARSPDELRDALAKPGAGGSHAAAMRHNPDLAMPFLQTYLAQDDIDVVSVAGCLGRDGDLIAVDHSRKLRAWPPGLGTGTRFEAVEAQPFTARAVDAVREILGVGLFEFEVLVHRPTGDLWALDLNPRAWGQISLAIARGHDMPTRWYEVVTGRRLTGSPPHRHRPRYWQSGVVYYVGAAVAIAAGPQRGARIRELADSLRQPRVGSVLDWRDPGPAIALSAVTLRHPARLIRRFLKYRREDRRVV